MHIEALIQYLMSSNHILFQIILGVIIADIISGFIHFAQDNIGSEKVPIWGKIVEDGRKHHEDPTAFTRSSVWERSKYAFIGSGLLYQLSDFIIGPTIWGISATIAGAFMIEIQVWAHRDKESTPRVIQALQWLGIMQSPRKHEPHHYQNEDGSPKQIAYCIITDWINPIFDYFEFWVHFHRWTARFHRKVD